MTRAHQYDLYGPCPDIPPPDELVRISAVSNFHIHIASTGIERRAVPFHTTFATSRSSSSRRSLLFSFSDEWTASPSLVLLVHSTSLPPPYYQAQLRSGRPSFRFPSASGNVCSHTPFSPAQALPSALLFSSLSVSFLPLTYRSPPITLQKTEDNQARAFLLRHDGVEGSGRGDGQAGRSQPVVRPSVPGGDIARHVRCI